MTFDLSCGPLWDNISKWEHRNSFTRHFQGSKKLSLTNVSRGAWPPPSYSTTSTHPNIVNNVNSVTNLEGNNSVGMASMHAPKVRSYSSGIWGHPPGKQLKFHAKNGAFYAFWELYLNKFTVPHFVIFRNYKNNYTKKGYLSQNP